MLIADVANLYGQQFFSSSFRGSRLQASLPAPDDGAPTMLHEITIEQFESLLGQTMALEYDEGALTVELVEVSALRSPSPRPQPSFSLTLRADKLAPLVEQGICRLQHPTLGALELFVVPTGPDGQGNCYQIIFN